jgi:hypothetical protein
MEQKSENLSPIQKHVVTHDSQLSLLVKMDRPHQVMEEVGKLFSDMFRKGDITPLSSLFEDIIRLFNGKLPGFKPCDTPYHNLKHTTDVFLATARLLHGAHIQRVALTAGDVWVGLTAALMHDTGYIQKNSEDRESGAVFLAVHVQRSMDFAQQHLSKTAFPPEFIRRCKKMILCTDLEHPFNQTDFGTDVDKTIAQMVAAADLMAQTADRNYLEKLPLLFQEFQKADIHRHPHELDHMKEAAPFNRFMRHRLTDILGGVDRYMRPHFKRRWDMDLDMYQEAIDRSMDYLSAVLEKDSHHYPKYLRRVNGL